LKAIAILGAGPAGLMAAHACAIKGKPFAVFAIGDEVNGVTKSKLGGAQFLHRAVPLLNDESPDAIITYKVTGTPSGYRTKVYGDEDVPFVSMEHVRDGQEVEAWSLLNTYDRLWEGLAGKGQSINMETVDAKTVAEWLEEDKFAQIISTIPKPNLCLTYQGYVDQPKAHTFVSQRIRISNEPALDLENTIVYDGTQDVSWYRTSNLFGCGSTEWGEFMREKALHFHTVNVRKPVRTDCRCFDGQVLFTGRFGAWRKGILTHHAFVETWKMLEA
jgi:FAD binding domain